MTQAQPPLQRDGVNASAARRTYFPELDGIRAIAILMVMTFHLAGSAVPIPGPVIVGQSGVDLFFVLSGFLITGILLKARQHDWHEVRVFYTRRALRIFPLYYFTLIVVWMGLLHDRVSWSVWVYLQNIVISLGLPMRGPMHFWSLAVEEQFYLVWPFLVLFLPRRFLLRVLGVIIVAAVLCRMPMLHAGYSIFYFTLTRMDALAAGALLAVLQARAGLAGLRTPMLALFLCSVGVLAAGSMATGPWRSVAEVSKYTAFAVLYASGIGLVLTSGTNALTAVLRGRTLRFVGRISYGLYVFHPLAFAFILPHVLWMPVPLRALAAFGSAFACALLSWYGMERYFIALKDKLAPERAHFPASAPSMTSI